MKKLLNRLLGWRKQPPLETPEFANTVIESILQWEHTASLTVLQMPDDPKAVESLLQEWFPGTSEESSRPGGEA